MKMRVLSMIIVLSLGILSVNGFVAGSTSFKVSGKCGMCETRIENAALSLKGVESAEWDKETGMITVEYGGKADVDKIQKKIATAGHDTELYKANDKVYNKLPECCKYDRAGAGSSACCSGSAKAACGSAK